jgi:hypothetical protein
MVSRVMCTAKQHPHTTRRSALQSGDPKARASAPTPRGAAQGPTQNQRSPWGLDTMWMNMCAVLRWGGVMGNGWFLAHQSREEVDVGDRVGHHPHGMGIIEVLFFFGTISALPPALGRPSDWQDRSGASQLSLDLAPAAAETRSRSEGEEGGPGTTPDESHEGRQLRTLLLNYNQNHYTTAAGRCQEDNSSVFFGKWGPVWDNWGYRERAGHPVARTVKAPSCTLHRWARCRSVVYYPRQHGEAIQVR